MNREFREVLACPRCFGPLELAAPSSRSKESLLVCQSDELRFRLVSGVPYLILPERRDAIDAYAAAYGEVWHDEGWGSDNSEYLLRLPYRDVTRRQSAKWRVKARSLEVLLRLLHEVGPSSVLDLGAGTGWLSYRLARKGYTVYAMDVLVDSILGLGAAQAYLEAGADIRRIQGEMERPPLRSGSMDIVVANASLHYASSLEVVLSQVRRVLRKQGQFIVMNSPVHEDSESANRAQADMRSRLAKSGAPPEVTERYHHFVRQDLQKALENGIGRLREISFDPGRWFRMVRRAKGIILRMELASFPILVATKQGPNLTGP